jgi:hypothetical protein
MSGCSVDQAVRLVHQAVLQDTKRNYGEAARCYREAITAFREVSRARGSSRRLQDLLATKLGLLNPPSLKQIPTGRLRSHVRSGYILISSFISE